MSRSFSSEAQKSINDAEPKRNSLLQYCRITYIATKGLLELLPQKMTKSVNHQTHQIALAKKKKEREVQRLRNYRSYHKYIGLVLAILLLISAITGFLLGWKKNIDLLQPPTQKGASTQMAAWKTTAELAETAMHHLYTSHPSQIDNPIDRMDFRPSKGIVKVLFENSWWEVQLDCTTGEVLSAAKRHADWIEQLHDGSIISDGFKLVSMNILGIGLTIMVLTGFWLWYGPKLVKRLRK